MIKWRAVSLMRAGCVLLGLSLIWVGAICLHNQYFAGPRQPVPLGWPARDALIDLNIAILIGAGIALLTGRWMVYGAAAAAAWLGVWVLVLHLPRMFAGNEAAWLGAAECAAIASAAACAAGLRSGRAIDATYALCLLAFGTAHFIYVQITADMVPPWLPERRFLAYFTGAGHLAAGISLLFGIWTRLATRLLAVMLACFTILVNLPIALAHGGFDNAALDLGFAIALTASAVILAVNRPPVEAWLPRSVRPTSPN